MAWPAPTASELGLLLLGIVAAVAAALRGRAGPPPAPPTGWQRGTLGVFALSLGFLLVYHHVSDPSWLPHGADWDSWYQSAVAWDVGLALHPMVRWPLNGAVTALVDLLVPGPLYQALQLTSLLSAAAATAAVYLLGHLLLGRAAGSAAAGLALLQPYTLEIAQWSSGYNLWAACAAWGAAGLAAALETRRWGWWAVAGAGTAGAFAAMPTGLPLGLGLLGLGTVLALTLGSPRRRALGALLAPVLLAAAFHAAFPGPLASLDGLVRYAREADGPAPAGRNADIDLTEGWVFGRSGPVTAFRTATLLGSGDGGDGAGVAAARNLAWLRAELGGHTPLLPGWLGAGVVAGLVANLRQRGRRRLAWAWLAVAGACLAVVPGLLGVMNIRFLLPMFWLLPLFIVAPVALWCQHGPRWLRLLPLATWGALLLPGSAWRFPPDRVNSVDVRAPEHMAQFYQGLRAQRLDTVHVCADPFSTWFALDAIPGTAGPTGFDNRQAWDLPASPDGVPLLVGHDPVGGFGGCDASGRALLATWTLPPAVLRLYGPRGAEAPPRPTPGASP